MLALVQHAGYEQPLAGSGSVGVHRMTEALKHAFALRMSLGELGRSMHALMQQCIMLLVPHVAAAAAVAATALALRCQPLPAVPLISCCC